MLVIFLNFIRGITAFKIFDGTRYYIKLILRSVSEVKYFLVMFIYSNIALGALYSVTRGNQIDLIESIYKLYILNFGYFDAGELSSNYDIVIFLSATIINLIIMLNLLISILGDFHDQFQLERFIIDYQEKAETSLEIQKLLFWRRDNNEKKFFHRVYKAGEEEENELWEGKILFIKNQVEMLEKNINDLDTNLTNKISKNIETSGLDIKEKLLKNFRKNCLKVDEMHDLVETKVKQVYELVESKQIEEIETIKSLERKVESLLEENKAKNESMIKKETEKIKLLEKKVELLLEENKEFKAKDKLIAKDESNLLRERLSYLEDGITKILEKLNP